jgi:tetratricopeptide (TPR) repeat protein
VADKGGAAAWSQFKAKQAKVDLTKADLSSLDLRGFNLAKADLAGSKLRNADLSGTDLSEASLTYADLRRANLAHAFLAKANLAVANLQGANMVDANLDFANLRSAKLSGAYLMGASLVEANLEGADMRGANLKFCNVTGATVNDADVEDADLSNVQLSERMMRQFRNLDKALVSFKSIMKRPAAQRSKLPVEENYDELFTDEDCFKILGVTRSATIEEIDKAYRRKVKEYHPDRVGHLGDKLKTVAAREFERIQVAYRTLSRRKAKPMMDLEIGADVELPDKGLKDYTVDDCLAVVRMAPNSDRAYYNLGIKYFESGLIEMAIQAYRKAIELNPYNYQAQHNLKIAFLAQTLSP